MRFRNLVAALVCGSMFSAPVAMGATQDTIPNFAPDSLTGWVPITYGDLFEPLLHLKQKLPDLKAAVSAAKEAAPIEIAASADGNSRPRGASKKATKDKRSARRKRSKV